MRRGEKARHNENKKRLSKHEMSRHSWLEKCSTHLELSVFVNNGMTIILT